MVNSPGVLSWVLDVFAARLRGYFRHEQHGVGDDDDDGENDHPGFHGSIMPDARDGQPHRHSRADPPAFIVP